MMPDTTIPLSQGLQRHTVAELLEVYTRDFLPLKAPSTQYHERLLFRWFCHDLGTIPLQDLSPLVLRSWRDSLSPCYNPSSIRRYMTALSAVLTAGVEHYEWLAKHPLGKVRKPPAPPDRERCLTAAEQARLLAACQASRNHQLHMAVVLALSTGARKNELLQRIWSDLDLERGTLRLARSKNGTRRAVPLVGQALALLRQHAQRSGTSRWVFPRRDGLKPVRIDYAWRKACARAGLTDFHFHDLRHTSSSYLAMSGASIRDIAEILGHKSLKQTMKYTHLMEPHTRGVLERMAEQYLGAAVAAPTAAPLAQTLSETTPTPPPIAPPLSRDIQVLEAVRALAPLPASAIQVAGTLHLPCARVRDILQRWARRGTLVRPSKGYYLWPGGTDTAAKPRTRTGLQPVVARPVGGASEAEEPRR